MALASYRAMSASRSSSSAPAGPGEQLLRSVEDEGAVGQVGQVVVERLVAQLTRPVVDELERPCPRFREHDGEEEEEEGQKEAAKEDGARLQTRRRSRRGLGETNRPAARRRQSVDAALATGRVGPARARRRREPFGFLYHRPADIVRWSWSTGARMLPAW